MASSSKVASLSIETTDDLVAAVQGLPDPEQVQKVLLPVWRKLQRQGTSRGVTLNQLLCSPLANNTDPLDALSTSDRLSFVYGCTVLARLQAPDSNKELLLTRLLEFARRPNLNQLVLVPELAVQMGNWLWSLGHQFGQLLPVIQVLRPLVVAFAKPSNHPNTHYLTPFHTHLAKACLYTRHFDAIIDILQDPVTEFENGLPLTYRDHLEYSYYGACILAAAGLLKDAIGLFQIAISVPGTVASAISLDAYKKYILVSLIYRGKVAPVPRFTSNAVITAFKNNGSPYLDFQTAFEAFDRRKVQELSVRLAEQFQRDGNTGLVQQCLGRLRLEVILRLRQAYITTTLEDIAKAIDSTSPVTPERLQSTQKDIQKLISDGEIHAEIEAASNGNATITFLEDPEPYNTEETLHLIASRTAQVQQTGALVNWLDSKLMQSREFVAKSLQSANAATAGGSAGVDEDIMGFGLEDL